MKSLHYLVYTALASVDNSLGFVSPVGKRIYYVTLLLLQLSVVCTYSLYCVFSPQLLLYFIYFLRMTRVSEKYLSTYYTNDDVFLFLIFLHSMIRQISVRTQS